MVIKFNNELYSVFKMEHRTPGNLRGFVQVKMRNLRSGSQIEHRFSSEDRVEKAMMDEHEMEFPTHKVDCFKNRVALEIEWNKKDPFYDRDFNNFRLLFDLRAVSVGVIITRGDELRDIFDALGKVVVWQLHDTHEQTPAED